MSRQVAVRQWRSLPRLWIGWSAGTKSSAHFSRSRRKPRSTRLLRSTRGSRRGSTSLWRAFLWRSKTTCGSPDGASAARPGSSKGFVLPVTRRRSRDFAPRELSSSERPTSTSSPWARRRRTAHFRSRVIRGTSTASRAAPPAAAPPRSRPASFPARWDRIRAGRSGNRAPVAESWVSSRRTAAFPATVWSPSGRRSTRSGRSHGRSRTRRASTP